MKKLSLLFILFLSSFSLFSQAKNNFTQQDYDKFFKEDCIPKDLIAEGQILLVHSPYEENATEKNNELNEIFKTYYKAPFVVVPSGVKDFKEKYKDTSVYKYGVGFNKDYADYGDNVKHPHYDIHLVDRVKLLKNTMPDPPKDLSKMTQRQRQNYFNEMGKNKEKYNLDPTAIIKTGLEDNESKLMKMTTFFAKKLGKYKE